MQTIQEHLKNCNRKEVIEAYIYKYLSNRWIFLDKNKTLAEHEKIYRDNLNDLIDRLIAIEPKPSEDRMIFLAAHCYPEDDGEDVRNFLIKAEDVDKDWATPYGYEFTPFEEAVAYEVADTYLTQYELTNILAEFLHDVTWTGLHQEYLEKEIAELDEAVKETEEHKDDPDYFMTHEEFIKHMETELGIELEKEDPEQVEARTAVMKHVGEYNTICQQIELKKLKKLLGK